MDFSKKQIAIFYIEKNKGIIYQTGEDKPLTISFPHDAVNNLEIVDKSKFEQILNGFITKNELKLTNVFIILSKHVTFEKEMKDVPISLQNVETENFLDMVPFHQVLTKTYNFSNKTIIITIDKNLCESIINIFAENQIPVGGIIPLSILEEKFPQLKEHFDEKFVLQKIVNLKQYFLPLGVEQQERSFTYDVPSFKNTQFILLVSVFLLLLIILGVMLYPIIFKSVHKPQQVKQVEVKKITPSPISTPSATFAPAKKLNY